MIDRDKFYFRVFCITFWVMAVSNFLIDEFLNSSSSARLSLVLASDVVILILGLVTLRQRMDKILIGIFVALGIISSLVNNIPALFWVNGFRDYISLLFGWTIMRYFFTSRYSSYFRNSFDWQLKFFLILQAFCVTFQFIKYGAGDAGGGSLGFGNSGNISILIIFISFYFVTKNWDGDNYLRSLWRNKIYIFLLFPVFLNETKVSFVLLFFYFLLLLPFNLRSVGKIFVSLPAIVILVGGMVVAYNLATDDSEYDISSFEFFDKYLTGGDEVEDIMDLADLSIEFIEEESDDIFYVDLPRFLKIYMMPEALSHTRGGLLLGAGIGQLKGGETLEKTEFARNNETLLAGTRMTTHLIFLPLGILGLIWIFFWYKHVLAFRTRFGEHPLSRKMFLLILAVLCFFYHDTFRYLIPCIVFYYLCLSTSYPLQEERQITKTSK